MRAVRRTTAGIEVVDIEPAEQTGVHVRIRSAGICGSDLTMVEAGPIPFTLGHEMAGELDDGTPVAIEPLVPCESCDACASGNYQLCEQAFIGIMGVGRDGGMCDEIVVPQRCLVPLPAAVAATDGCLVEPLAVAVHALRVADITPTETVTVFGAGAIGLCVVAAAVAAGCTVHVEARYEHQRFAASQLGATSFDNPCDVAVVAVASDRAMHEAIAACRPRGTVIVVATFWDQFSVPGLPAMTKELRIVPAFAYCRHAGGRDIDGAAALLATWPTVADTLITHRFPLDSAAEAFRAAADRRSGAIKVAVLP